ncbi:MAG: YadA-like family protein [Dialister pneumosintes]|nr:yadA-like C-terminal domain protein [Dialister sp. CAG:588]
MSKQNFKKSVFLTMAISAFLMAPISGVHATPTLDELNNRLTTLENDVNQTLPTIAGKAKQVDLNNEIQARTDKDNELEGKITNLTNNKSDKTYVDTELGKKVNATDFNQFKNDTNATLTGLAHDKAAKAYVDDELAKKANTDDVYKKAETYNQTEINDKLNKKANSADVYKKSETYSKDEVNAELAKKADKTTVNALKSDLENTKDKLSDARTDIRYLKQNKADKVETENALNTLTTRIATEETNRKANERILHKNIQDEISARESADHALSARITAEETVRAEADARHDRELQAATQNVSDLQKEVKNTTSMTAALAALKPLTYNPEAPIQIMAGYGNYRGQSAAALGLAYYKNENNLLHMGVSYAGNKDVAANAGITWRVGKGVSTTMTSDSEVTAELKALQKEVRACKDSEKAQKEIIESMQKQIAELTRQLAAK